MTRRRRQRSDDVMSTFAPGQPVLVDRYGGPTAAVFIRRVEGMGVPMSLVAAPTVCWPGPVTVALPTLVATGQLRPHSAVSEVKDQRAWTASFYGRDAEGIPVVLTARSTYVEAQRAGRYLTNVRRLADGRIAPAQFRARTRRVTIAGRPVVSDPRTALVLDAAERQRNAEGRPELFGDDRSHRTRRAGSGRQCERDGCDVKLTGRKQWWCSPRCGAARRAQSPTLVATGHLRPHGEARL